MDRYGLTRCWTTGEVGSRDEWAERCRKLVNEHELDRWQRATEVLPSLRWYVAMKSTLRREPWLGVHFNAQQRRVKLLARVNALDLAPNIAAKLRVPADQRQLLECCPCCNDGLRLKLREDIPHFVMLCTAYDDLRSDMLQRIATVTAIKAGARARFLSPRSGSSTIDRMSVLLGGRLEEGCYRPSTAATSAAATTAATAAAAATSGIAVDSHEDDLDMPPAT